MFIQFFLDLPGHWGNEVYGVPDAVFMGLVGAARPNDLTRLSTPRRMKNSQFLTASLPDCKLQHSKFLLSMKGGMCKSLWPFDLICFKLRDPGR